MEATAYTTGESMGDTNREIRTLVHFPPYGVPILSLTDLGTYSDLSLAYQWNTSDGRSASLSESVYCEMLDALSDLAQNMTRITQLL